MQRRGDSHTPPSSPSFCRYGLKLFTVMVKDRLGRGHAVCFFITQDETTATIREALSLLKDVSGGIQPAAVMLDKCAAEIKAVKDVFPDADILLCRFHVRQAWHR